MANKIEGGHTSRGAKNSRPRERKTDRQEFIQAGKVVPVARDDDTARPKDPWKTASLIQMMSTLDLVGALRRWGLLGQSVNGGAGAYGQCDALWKGRNPEKCLEEKSFLVSRRSLRSLIFEPFVVCVFSENAKSRSRG
jgi:hypothetical protein